MKDYKAIITGLTFEPDKFAGRAEAVAEAYSRREKCVAEVEETRAAIREGMVRLTKMAATFASEEQQGIFSRRLAELLRAGGVNSKKWADYERVRDAQLRTFGECHEPRPLVERPDPKPEAEYAKVVKPDLEAAVAIGGLFAELARREAALKVAENDLRLAAEVFAGACGKLAKDEKMIADGLEYFAEYADEVLTENREHMKLEEAEMAERKRRLGL